jgi:3-(3-hydroxy-phenyl)propionate hydroxylase
MLLQYLQPEVVMYFQPESYAHVPLPAGSGPHSVVVVGAGPVGLATALGLAQRGVRVLVLEAGDSVSFGSRAICLSRNSLQILDRLGVGDRFVELSLPWTRGRSFYRDDEVLVFDMPAAEEYARPPMVNISQSVAEQILVDRVADEVRGLPARRRPRLRRGGDARRHPAVAGAVAGGRRRRPQQRA